MSGRSPVDRGPFNRAVDAAIARYNRQPVKPSPLCGMLVDGAPCGLAAGHVDRAGTPHRSAFTPPAATRPCIEGCGLAAEEGDVYCSGCRSAIR
jgi:hypothetical protein